MRTKLITSVGILTLVGVAATGCVRHDRYDTMLEATNSLKEQLVRAESNRSAATNALATRDRQLAQARANLSALQEQYNMLSGELDSISTANEMWFDADSGMLRFGSDFTFSSGQAQLKKSAEELIARVATILNSNEAANFEIVVVGHTDNIQPKSSAVRYPTNWELSAARAVSVAKALAYNGTDPSRFQVAGFGEYRPLVANREGGTKENRRVEIYLQPMTDTSAWDTSAGDSTETAIVDTSEEPMK